MLPSIASARIVAVILLASFLPGAKATCWIDKYVISTNHISICGLFPLNLNSLFSLLNDLSNGNETCDGLSDLARALIGLAFCAYQYPYRTNPHHNSPHPTRIASNYITLQTQKNFLI